jgi:molybdopterin synthase catalytic subunit
MFLLSAQPLDPVSLRRRLERPDAGAVVVFEGMVRNSNAGQSVESLEYEAAPDLCAAEAERVMGEAMARFSVLDLVVAHRVGRLKIGEMAVWIGVVAAHRDGAFAACRYVIEELKVRLPVWKKEHYAGGSSCWLGEDSPQA